MQLHQLSVIQDSVSQRYRLDVIGAHSRSQGGQRLWKIWEAPLKDQLVLGSPSQEKNLVFHIAAQYGDITVRVR